MKIVFKIIVILQLFLFAGSIFGITEKFSSDVTTINNKDISQIYHHDPFHGHSGACKEHEEKHICHFGHCACAFCPKLDLDSVKIVHLEKIISNEYFFIFLKNNFNQVFRPPIFQA